MPFISFEGIDGAGKTTQLQRTADWLSQLGVEVVKTKEPDGGHIGAHVRQILIAQRASPLSTIEELLLVFAARYDHVCSVVRPALAASSWVLTDRFVDSTYALQVHDLEVSEALFSEAAAAVVGGTMPDVTLILDLEVSTAMARRSARDKFLDDPAELTRDFQRVAEGFRTIAARNPGRCRIIDAAREQDLVFNDVKEVILSSGLLRD